MELFDSINEPAVLGVSLFLLALRSVCMATDGTATEQLSIKTVYLFLMYVLAVGSMAAALYIVRLFDVSLWLASFGMLTLLLVGTIERMVATPQTSRSVVREALWKLVFVITAVCLLWWWPW